MDSGETKQEQSVAAETSFVGMTDMDLQQRCVAAGALYVSKMHPGIDDLEKKHLMQNACAAGYSKGYRDAMVEVAKELGKEVGT